MDKSLLKVSGKISLAREAYVSTSEWLVAILEDNYIKSSSQESLVDEITKTTKLKDEYSIKVDSLWSM